MTTLQITAGVIGLLVIGGMAWIAYRDHQRRVREDVRETWDRDWPDDEDDEPMPACAECGDYHTPTCEDEYL